MNPWRCFLCHYSDSIDTSSHAEIPLCRRESMKTSIKLIGLNLSYTLCLVTFLFFLSCSNNQIASKAPDSNAEKFIEEVEKSYSDAVIKESRASWIQSNFITADSEAMAADAKQETIKTVKDFAEKAR